MHDCIIIVIITSAAFLSSTSTAEDQQTIHCTHTNMTILLKYLYDISNGICIACKVFFAYKKNNESHERIFHFISIRSAAK